MSARHPEGAALDTERQGLQVCLQLALVFRPCHLECLGALLLSPSLSSCALQERLDRQNGLRLTSTSEAVRTAAVSMSGFFSALAQY